MYVVSKQQSKSHMYSQKTLISPCRETKSSTSREKIQIVLKQLAYNFKIISICSHLKHKLCEK